jgi:hypothetical protein
MATQYRQFHPQDKLIFDDTTNRLIGIRLGNGAVDKFIDGVIASGLWSARPLASSVPVGAKYLATDIGTGGSEWRSDGTYWRPANGRVVLATQAGSVATPLATLAGTGAAGLFTLPVVPTIPVGMIFPGCRVRAEATVTRTAGVVGSGQFQILLGVNGTTADSAATVAINTTTSGHTWLWASVALSATNTYSAPSSNGRAPGISVTSIMVDRTANNAASALLMSIGFTATNSVGDAFALLDYQASVEG